MDKSHIGQMLTGGIKNKMAPPDRGANPPPVMQESGPIAGVNDAEEKSEDPNAPENENSPTEQVVSSPEFAQAVAAIVMQILGGGQDQGAPAAAPAGPPPMLGKGMGA